MTACRPACTTRRADIQPRAAYATSKRYGEERLLELVDDGLCPVILRNGTVYGWSPADALRPRRQHVRQGRAAQRQAACCTAAAGCGGRWSTSATCADAMIAAFEAPAEKVRGEIFNVLHSNYQIRELAMLVAGSVQVMTGRRIELEEIPAPTLTRDYECSNAKLSTTLGFIPRHSVLEAVTDILARVGRLGPHRAHRPARATTSAGWSCCHELKPGLERFATVL